MKHSICNLLILFLFYSCVENEIIEDNNITFDCNVKAKFPNDEVSTLSRLRVVGNSIVNDNCDCITLKGVSLIDPYFIVEYEGGFKEEDFKSLKEDWNISILRLPIHPELLKEHPNYLEKYVDPIVNYANKYGYYVLLGYHAHGNINTGQSEMPEWRFNLPWKGNPFNADQNLAINSLKQLANRYKNKPWVIYGTFNEPAFINWTNWYSPAENLVDVIHNIDNNALVTVSGTDWGYDLYGVFKNPVNRKNVIYEIHPYPWKGKNWKPYIEKLSKRYPIIIGEWGFENENMTYGKAILKFAKANKIGRIAWGWHHEWQPAIFKNKNKELTTFGTLVKQDLQ